MSMIGGGDVPLPSFMNHLEGGSFTLTSGDVSAYGEYDIQLTNIAKPKGIIVFSNSFNCLDAKADKPFLGAFACLYVEPADAENLTTTNGWNILSSVSSYNVNWGQNTGQAQPTARNSWNENNRGVYLFNESTKKIRIKGFSSSQGEYDFKFNVTYNWIAWD